MTVRELFTKIGIKIDDQQIKKSEEKIKKFGVRAKLLLAGAVAGIFALGKKAVDAAADMEMLTTQFEVMLGSTEKATKMMEELKKFSAETPFSLKDLSEGSQQLLSFGVTEDQVIKKMKMLGDTSGGNTEKLKGLILAYGKVTVKGKASMEELNMMAERGLPIFKVLSTQMNVSRDDLFKLVSKGKITEAQVTKAFETMTSSGGMFFEGMKKQSLTLKGIISTMKDNFTLLLADVGKILLPVIKQIVGTLTQLFQGPLGKAINVLIKALIPVIQMVGNLLGPIFEALLPIFEGLTEVLKPIIDIIMAVLIPLLEILMPIMKIVGMILKVIGAVLQNLLPVFKMFGVLLSFVAKILNMLIPILKPWFRILEIIAYLLGAILNPLLDVFVKLLEPLAFILEIIAPILKIVAVGFKIIGDILQEIVKTVKWFMNQISGLTGGMVTQLMKEYGLDKKGKIQRPAEGADKILKKDVINNTNRKATVIMNNKVSMKGSPITGGAGARENVEKMADALFSVKLKKILINSGY